jgi:hypothetical protein
MKFTHREKSNSVKSIIDYLSLTVFATEGMIQRNVFGYYRSSTSKSNKKYADMLRRAVRKGTIKRFKTTYPGIKSQYFYYVGTYEEFRYQTLEMHAEQYEFAMKNLE